jgi:predicted nucleic acid-binding protein
LSRVVVDASTALAWCFPDETNVYADAVLVALEGSTILVPAIWSLEVANAMLAGERRKRLGPGQVREFTRLLEGLSLIQDTQGIAENVSEVLPVARTYGLSAYDAAYLELALRHGAPLATLDDKLEDAARRAGVGLFRAVVE